MFRVRPTRVASRRHFGIRLGVLPCLLLALCGMDTLSCRANSPTEYQVKAAFLYNFAKFIEWPSQAFPQANDPLVLGLLGQDPFGEDLERTVAGQSVHGRRIVIKRMEDPANSLGCHILFIGLSERKRLPEILKAMRGRSTLTVGEMDQFAALGGMIHFITIDNKIRFEINLDAAKQSELKISSKLLSLATRVIRGGSDPSESEAPTR